jgi:putative CocE/NonD family hydrolase
MKMFSFSRDLRWRAECIGNYLKKITVLPFKSMSSETPDPYPSITCLKNVAIPVRDGVKLYANIYKPKIDGRFPVLLIRLPYGKDEFGSQMIPEGKFWAKKGYVCITQDVRGKFASQGEWTPFIREANDGYDTLQWIIGQSWCDGSIGMLGDSYNGYCAWAAAASNHPHLKCIAPGFTAMDIYGTWVYNNGAFCMNTIGTWAISQNGRRPENKYRINRRHLPLSSIDDGTGKTCSYYKDWIKNPTRNSFWDTMDLTGFYVEINIPVLHIGGWMDVFIKGTLNDWQGVVSDSKTSYARKNQWLIIGPYDHSRTCEKTKTIGRIVIGDRHIGATYSVRQHFFDYWLKGMDNGFGETERIKLFTINDNSWRYETQWPLLKTHYLNYYFHSHGNANRIYGNGLLNLIPPDDEPFDRYVYDPAKPVDAAEKMDLWDLAHTMEDRHEIERRYDVVVYTSTPLEKATEITGRIMVTLYASSSAPDTDFTAALVDLFPDGYAHLIQEGIMRASFRHSNEKQVLIKPEKIYKYQIDLNATSYLIKQGHKIRVEISSSNFDRYDRNLNTGNPLGISDKMEVAIQKIYHTRKYPSHVTLPVIPRLKPDEV